MIDGFTPGTLVRARRREWIVLAGGDDTVLRLRPTTGSEDDVVLGAGGRPESQDGVVPAGQHDPLAATGPNQGSRGEAVDHRVTPSARARAEMASDHDARSPTSTTSKPWSSSARTASSDAPGSAAAT